MLLIHTFLQSLQHHFLLILCLSHFSSQFFLSLSMHLILYLLTLVLYKFFPFLPGSLKVLILIIKPALLLTGHMHFHLLHFYYLLLVLYTSIDNILLPFFLSLFFPLL